jgi:predicted Zn-dependent protease
MFVRLIVLLLVCCALAPVPALARGDLNVIRDAETENWLRDLAAPVWKEAGIPRDSINIVLVQNNAINAFVAGGMNIFIYTGLLKAAKTPDEILGVLAHETGHIAGGHLLRGQEEMKNASTTAILATIAGIAAAAASQNGAAGGAAVSLGQQVAQRSFLQYSRTQESAADQAALRYLSGAGLSAQGMADFLARLADQELLPTDQQSEFVRTHPLTRERVEAVLAAVAREKDKAPLGPDVRKRFERLMAKLTGYFDPRGTLQKYPANETSFAGRYARTLALHQTGDTRAALALLDSLMKDSPNDPYLYEFKGQILYETGQPVTAIAPYRKAVELSGGNALIRLGLAQALLASGNDADLAPATDQLEAALTKERKSPQLWRLLATAYGRENNLGMAAYALAEEAAARGDDKTAVQQAKRAQSILPQGSPGWLRAGDVLAKEDKTD